MQRAKFQRRVLSLQIAKWSRNQNDMEGIVYALILKATENRQEYRRRDLAIMPQGNGATKRELGDGNCDDRLKWLKCNIEAAAL